MASIWTTVRTHWKKTIFFNCVSYCVADYLYTRHQNFLMMKNYCNEATAQGRKPLPFGSNNKHITLLLNPVAARRKSKDKYEKYAEPIIHCAGFLVNVAQTERISEARDLTALIEKTNIIAIAGGDGTLLETITGLLRREDADEAVRRYPIAVIPTGAHNEFARKLYPSYASDQMLIAEAAMAIVRHHMEPQHVAQFQIVKKEVEDVSNISAVSENPELEKAKISTEVPTIPKPIFAMSGMKIGQYREAEEIQRKLPTFLGQYVTTFISLFRAPEQMFKAEIRYTPACYGCSKCYKEEKITQTAPSLWSRFYSVLRPSPVYAKEPNSRSENPECGVWNSICVETPEFNINVMPSGYLKVDVGNRQKFSEFFLEGVNRLYGKQPNYRQSFDCNEIEIKPLEAPEFCSIDNEEFEMQQIRVKLLRNKVYFFTQV